ncbi:MULTISPECIES: hypothetical protein [Actinomadura]|uniref:hypothetical protein n=1 Tax=Actinomadura TaxID=1988 RepID=UPI0004102CA2|nr:MULTISPECIES: hypothetical protein [Actinomadura]RSN67953.1 hypothetical protein DMH08_12195 [Actinomadura sp. WAC 06369]
MRARSDRRAIVDERQRADLPAPERPGPAAPGPLITTRALLIILIALVAAGICAAAPEAAIPIGVGVGVVTLLAQIVKD